MSHISSTLSQDMTVDGHQIQVSLFLTAAGFTGTIIVPPDCSQEFRAIFASRLLTWRRIMNIEHEGAIMHHFWKADGRHLIVEGTGWRPNERDLAQLCLFLQSGQAAATAAPRVVEDVETEVPKTRTATFAPLLAPTG
jgi:hypothetical protein